MVIATHAIRQRGTIACFARKIAFDTFFVKFVVVIFKTTTFCGISFFLILPVPINIAFRAIINVLVILAVETGIVARFALLYFHLRVVSVGTFAIRIR